MDRKTSKRITEWVTKNLVDCEDPRKYGKPLNGNHKNGGDTE
jgi:mRNA-degrading endonuclease RelE of RelBE toxin-antitoxin system